VIKSYECPYILVRLHGVTSVRETVPLASDETLETSTTVQQGTIEVEYDGLNVCEHETQPRTAEPAASGRRVHDRAGGYRLQAGLARHSTFNLVAHQRRHCRRHQSVGRRSMASRKTGLLGNPVVSMSRSSSASLPPERVVYESLSPFHREIFVIAKFSRILSNKMSPTLGQSRPGRRVSCRQTRQESRSERSLIRQTDFA
jgi:hypothetical protein